MTNSFKKAWAEMLRPLLKRPHLYQVAALCYRERDARTEVLLITSRGTGRWILPKGWPIDGLNSPQAALQEAWEEAGVEDGVLTETPIGTFDYAKYRDEGYATPVQAQVYKVRAERLADVFPECDERRRIWVSPEEAANMVQEPGLKAILRKI